MDEKLQSYYDFLNSFTEVSRETFSQLVLFIEEITLWNKKINLFSAGEMNKLWQRHIIDSAQLMCYINNRDVVLTDFGSGAGFPGIILAILGVQEVNLIESNNKKCAFLNQIAARIATKSKIIIHNKRIEQLTPWKTDIITARACAPLITLLPLIKKFSQENNFCLLHKGKNIVQEIEEAKQKFGFNYQLHKSVTDANAFIMQLDF